MTLHGERPLTGILYDPGECPPGLVLQATDYTWERLDSSKDIRAFHALRIEAGIPVLGDVRVQGKPQGEDVTQCRGGFQGFGYATSYQYQVEGIGYGDGTALVAASVSEFAGTFASHDDIEVWFFALTPKPVQP